MANCAFGGTAGNSCRRAGSRHELAPASLDAGVQHILLFHHAFCGIVPPVVESCPGDVSWAITLQGDEALDGIPSKHGEASRVHTEPA